MTLKVYCYDKCGTCKKALKYLDESDIDYQTVPIREKPPSKTALKKMLKHQGGAIKKLFNTSSKDYKEGNFKERLPEMSADEAVEVLSKTGNLVKRPFVLGEGFGLVGFKPEVWDGVLK